MCGSWCARLVAGQRLGGAPVTRLGGCWAVFRDGVCKLATWVRATLVFFALLIGLNAVLILWLPASAGATVALLAMHAGLATLAMARFGDRVELGAGGGGDPQRLPAQVRALGGLRNVHHALTSGAGIRSGSDSSRRGDQVCRPSSPWDHRRA